jgi:hypothetical protein
MHENMKNYYTFLLLLLISLVSNSLFSSESYTLKLKEVNNKKLITKEKVKKVKPLVALKITQQPFLDGIAIDKCWTNASPMFLPYSEKNKTISNKKISIKACHDNIKIYFLIQYSTNKELREHKFWHWNPVLQSYIPGKEEEEAFTIILAEKRENNQEADIWIWRAGRTDPVNKADDLFYSTNARSKESQIHIKMDNGKCAWFSKYFGNYSGIKLPRFYNRTPTGSVADVSAKGCWGVSNLNIEFAREKNTNHSDDIQLTKRKYFIKILNGIPNIKNINKGIFTPLIIQ